MTDFARKFATNLGWVVAAIWAILLGSFVTVSLTQGAVPAPVAVIGSSALLIAGYLTYQQSLAEA